MADIWLVADGEDSVDPRQSAGDFDCCGSADSQADGIGPNSQPDFSDIDHAWSLRLQSPKELAQPQAGGGGFHLVHVPMRWAVFDASSHFARAVPELAPECAAEFRAITEAVFVGNVQNSTAVIRIRERCMGCQEAPMLDVVHDSSGSLKKPVEPGTRYPEFARHLLDRPVSYTHLTLPTIYSV